MFSDLTDGKALAEGRFADDEDAGDQLRRAEEALDHDDLLFIQFVEKFELKFLNQGGYQNRSIFDSLDLAWDLLRTFPPQLLNKIDPKTKEKYYRRGANEGRPAA